MRLPSPLSGPEITGWRERRSGTFPWKGYEEKVAARNQESLQNVMVEKNRVSGTVSLSTDKFMVFSIPWSEGWSVYVDGRERELQKANVMYMGLELEAGDHEIELCYCTPGHPGGSRGYGREPGGIRNASGDLDPEKKKKLYNPMIIMYND